MSNDLPDPVDAPDLRDRPEPEAAGPRAILPADCPVEALGVMGNKHYFLDHLQQMRELTPRNLDKGELAALFGGSAAVASFWPKMVSEKDELTDERVWRAKRSYNPRTERFEVWEFDQNRAQDDLIRACAEKKIFDPQGRLFGRGAHRRKADDALVFHLGDRVIVVSHRDPDGKPALTISDRMPGWIEREIYPALGPLPPPAPEASSDEEAEQAMNMIGEWIFAEPEAARLILLGWLGCAMMCGALQWRPHVWLTGETAAGKSTLQKWLRAVLDEFGLFTEDASEAAVRQVLGDDTLPVLIDEAEADDNPERQRAMLKLARKASSGSKIHRGSSDHKAKDFTAQSAFLFSAIIHSPLEPQDRNRFAILEMKAIPPDKGDLVIDWQYWRRVGRRFQRRMIEQWPRFDRTLADYKTEIQKNGFEGRWRDTFGTLLACADMLLHHCAPSRESEANESYGREAKWVRSVLPMMAAARVEAQSTTERCIGKLTSSLLPPARGMDPETVGRWLVRATTFDDQSGGYNKTADEKLRSHGLRVLQLYENEKTGERSYGKLVNAKDAYVAIAYSTHEGLNALFKGSQWYAGGWVQALSGVPNSFKPKKVHFDGSSHNALLLPIKALLGREVGASEYEVD